MAIPAPYRFVPLSKFVLLPEWGHQVSHDHPFADGVSGELDVTLTCHTPLCVGGQRDEATDRQPATVRFCRDHAGNPIIPGTSIKGMLRNVLEIATFARFRQVDDQKLGVRDITEATNFYCTSMVGKTKAGWLRFNGENWTVTPCEFVRVHHDEILRHFNVSRDVWRTKKQAAKRYGIAQIGITPHVTFTQSGILAELNSAGTTGGNLVMTGQPGKTVYDLDPSDPRYENNLKAVKKKEFIFYNAAADALKVEPAVMNGFFQIHSNPKVSGQGREANAEWDFWQKKLKSGEARLGVPVFYQGSNKVESLGLAMMYRLPCANSIHDAIGHSHAQHLQSGALDFSDLLFGTIDEDNHGRASLRGRVAISAASSAVRPTIREHGPVILSSPKPTFYPAYVRQTGQKFKTLMDADSELAGWKRYQTKPLTVQHPEGKAADNTKTQSILECVDEGSSFTFKIRFHNLRVVELGALLWALDFGGRQECRYNVGLGKPFGFGQVALAYSLDNGQFRHNQQSLNAEDKLARILCARDDFEAYMDETFSLYEQRISWKESDPVKALLNYAKPAAESRNYCYLPEPKKFVEFKRASQLTQARELHAYNLVHCRYWTGEVAPYRQTLTERITQLLDRRRAKDEQEREVRAAQEKILAEREEIARRAAEEKERKAAIAAAIAAAPLAERLVMALTTALAESDQDRSNKTLRDKLITALDDARKNWDELGPTEVAQIKKAAEGALAFTGYDGVVKAAKKLINK